MMADGTRAAMRNEKEANSAEHARCGDEKCGQILKEEDNVIQCVGCTRLYHAGCEKMSSSLQKELYKDKKQSWICKNILNNLQVENKKLKSELEDLREECVSMRTEMNTIESENRKMKKKCQDIEDSDVDEKGSNCRSADESHGRNKGERRQSDGRRTSLYTICRKLS